MQPLKSLDDIVFRFRATLTTRWSDEDNQAVLNNAVYLTLLEEARLRYFTDLGLMEGGSFPFVLAQSHLRFAAPGRGGEEVVVEVRTTRLGNSSFEQVSRVLHASTQELWCEAEALLVAWDPLKRGKRSMTDEFRERVAAFEGLA